MNNITIGQYIPGDSLIHKLDPRIKLLSMIVLIAAVFMIPVELKIGYMITLAVSLVFTVMIILLSGIPFTRVLKGLKPMVFLLTFTFVIQLFTIQTGEQLFQGAMSLSIFSVLAIVLLIVLYFILKPYVKFKTLFFLLLVIGIFALQYAFANDWKLSFDFLMYPYQLTITSDGLLRAGFIFIRIMNVMMIASLLTFTTSTIELNDGLESILKPFKYIGLPTSTIAMMFALTMRSIPTLLEETERIMKAQTSRGVDFKESKLKDKIMQIISLLIPIFVIQFKRAEELANAMEVRGYVIGAKRTKIDTYRIVFKDIAAIVCVLLLLTAIIVVRIYAV